jgi:hypothetical protein
LDARTLILTELQRHFRSELAVAHVAGFTWDDHAFLRTSILRCEQGDASAWEDFLGHLSGRDSVIEALRQLLEARGWIWLDQDSNQLCMGALPPGILPLVREEAAALLQCLSLTEAESVAPDQSPAKLDKLRSVIMYIESKPDLTGSARIGRVTLSKTGRTLYYGGRRFQSLKGDGYKANYRDVDTGDWYWLSKCRADGRDTLYPGIVEIDEDVREEYWLTIRKQPDLIKSSSFRSEGKHSKRQPK